MKSRTTAALLALFLGGFGVHRFYLGQTGLGFLYLIFCWTFIPAFIALIDFLCFLSTNDEVFNQKYNQMFLILNAQKQQTQQAQPNPSNNANAISINMGNPTPPVTSITSISEEIKKLYELKEKGIITQEEFDLKKKTLL